jgi:predicted metal-dependent phosphoesterase TrpH
MDQTWSKADIHIHTTYSDGTADVEGVLEYVATRTHLRVIAITDHDTIAGALKARRLAPAYGIEVIVGEEISTAEGHLLALFIERPVVPKQPAAATIAAVHAQNGLCVAAHPYDRFTPSLGRAGLRKRCAGVGHDWPLDAIEGFNASLWLPRANLAAAATGAELRLPLVGGSDSHHPATIGLGYTLFPGHTAADLRYAIRTRMTRPGGASWRWMHNAEYIGLWLRARAARALSLSAS